jgi:acetyl esterase/lipase
MRSQFSLAGLLRPMILSFVSFVSVLQAHASEPGILNLWPSAPPNETKELPPEADTSKPSDRGVAGKPLIRLGNVSVPQLAIYRPAKEVDTGTAIIICPGGGHNILAYDLEGTEVAEWLNTVGITGIVLKYRVPARDPQKRWSAAVQDGQRAVSLVKSNAKKWGLEEDKIGILGFSAGGETAGRTALMFDQRQYAASDPIDQISCRPDFAVLIYPAYMADAKTATLLADVPVSEKSPPMFLVHAWDDGVTPLTSLLLATELKKANVSAELHLFATGGHGYGMRPTEEPCTRWPELCEKWLRGRKLAK